MSGDRIDCPSCGALRALEPDTRYCNGCSRTLPQQALQPADKRLTVDPALCRSLRPVPQDGRSSVHAGVDGRGREVSAPAKG